MGSTDASKGATACKQINDRHELRPGPAVPGPVGLLIRVVLGAASVYALVELVTKWDVFSPRYVEEARMS